jgi:hypothetical protein
MNKTVPSPTNWPQLKQRKNSKKIHAIDWRLDGTAIAYLTHVFREIQQGNDRPFRAFALVAVTGTGDDRYFTYYVGGEYRRDEILKAIGRLHKWVEDAK